MSTSCTQILYCLKCWQFSCLSGLCPGWQKLIVLKKYGYSADIHIIKWNITQIIKRKQSVKMINNNSYEAIKIQRKNIRMEYISFKPLHNV